DAAVQGDVDAEGQKSHTASLPVSGLTMNRLGDAITPFEVASFIAAVYLVVRAGKIGCGGSSAPESTSLLDSSLGRYLLLFSTEMPNRRSSLGRRPALSR